MVGVRRGLFTCVGWKVTLCDPIWQVTLRSCEISINSYTLPLPFYLHLLLWSTSGTTECLLSFTVLSWSSLCLMVLLNSTTQDYLWELDATAWMPFILLIGIVLCILLWFVDINSPKREDLLMYSLTIVGIRSQAVRHNYWTSLVCIVWPLNK